MCKDSRFADGRLTRSTPALESLGLLMTAGRTPRREGDYLVGDTDLLLEKNVVSKIVDIQKLGQEDKAHVFALLDAFLQSHKAKK